MKLRLVAVFVLLLGLVFVWNACGGASGGTHLHATKSAGNLGVDNRSNAQNLNQQYSGWTFGKIMGVSIGPEHAPPPPMFGRN